MISVYYDPITLQVEAYLDSPNMAPVKNWQARGYIQAPVLDGVHITRDHQVILDASGLVIGAVYSENINQPVRRIDTLRASGLSKLYQAAGLTQAEIKALE